MNKGLCGSRHLQKYFQGYWADQGEQKERTKRPCSQECEFLWKKFPFNAIIRRSQNAALDWNFWSLWGLSYKVGMNDKLASLSGRKLVILISIIVPHNLVSTDFFAVFLRPQFAPTVAPTEQRKKGFFIRLFLSHFYRLNRKVLRVPSLATLLIWKNMKQLSLRASEDCLLWKAYKPLLYWFKPLSKSDENAIHFRSFE